MAGRFVGDDAFIRIGRRHRSASDRFRKKKNEKPGSVRAVHDYRHHAGRFASENISGIAFFDVDSGVNVFFRV